MLNADGVGEQRLAFAAIIVNNDVPGVVWMRSRGDLSLGPSDPLK